MLSAKDMKPGSWAIKVIVIQIKLDMVHGYIIKMPKESMTLL